MTAASSHEAGAPLPSFGVLLRTFRERVEVRVRRSNGTGSWVILERLSQHELARRSGIDRTYVSKLEAGVSPLPSRDVALKLADELHLDEIDQARLIIAAGYWPWPETDDADVELAVRVLLAVVRGDYRRLEDAGC